MSAEKHCYGGVEMTFRESLWHLGVGASQHLNVEKSLWLKSICQKDSQSIFWVVEKFWIERLEMT